MTPEERSQKQLLLRALKLRQELAKTSTAKYDSLQHATSEDRRMRGGWQFYGASRTGRVAGRVLNPANLVRPPPGFPAEDVAEWLPPGDLRLLSAAWPQYDTLSTLSYCIRAMVKAPAGRTLAVADLTSIESVGSAWLAGCKTVLDIFAQGRDTYRTLAASAEGISYDSVTKAQRTYYKPVCLGGVYRLGGAGLQRYAKQFGVELPEEKAKSQIRHLRETWHEYPEYWRRLETAAMDAVKNPRTMHKAHAIDGHTWILGERVYGSADWPVVSYWYDGEDFLYCALPSGRFLCYFHPSVEPAVIAEGTENEFHVPEALHYYGNLHGGGWAKINVHSGSLLENVTQALCRDAMWVALELAGADLCMDVLGDVYDEILCEVDEADTGALDRLIGYLTTSAPWMTPEFFLGAEGYVSNRFKKG